MMIYVIKLLSDILNCGTEGGKECVNPLKSDHTTSIWNIPLIHIQVLWILRNRDERPERLKRWKRKEGEQRDDDVERCETGRDVLLREEVARGSKIVSAPERRMRRETEKRDRQEGMNRRRNICTELEKGKGMKMEWREKIQILLQWTYIRGPPHVYPFLPFLFLPRTRQNRRKVPIVLRFEFWERRERRCGERRMAKGR